ncbi:MAG: transcriptional repressor [Chloroflexi bacterium]|nr:MAG: transcriptional repressor [Chloroflexota bacterium]
MRIELSERLKAAGYKLTAPRRAIIKVLESHPEHLSHSQILEAGKHFYPRLSRATVYRTMELLTGLNLVRPLYLSDATQRFVLVEGGHHHLVCTRCGTIIELDECAEGELVNRLAERYGFTIHSHLLELQGQCADCRCETEK